ncbi:MAG: hypothetical protein JWM92_604 [Candidatus Nomurabacteria bacterium]|nr:hypothetical protein [Candidatus Nomurabacteria bacterium]
MTKINNSPQKEGRIGDITYVPEPWFAIQVIKDMSRRIMDKNTSFYQKQNINFYSAVKIVTRAMRLYPERFLPFISSRIVLQARSGTWRQYEGEGGILDAMRILVACYPQKKVRILARAAYKAFPKPVNYKPINVPQAI